MNKLKLIYSLLPEPKPIIGKEYGICRITGEEGEGIPFKKWVKPTFTDHSYLHPGDIISNEAAFCFSEVSAYFAKIVGRDKPQNFRTYCHIVTKNDEWLCLTKGDKKQIVEILSNEPKIVSLTDTGKKHIFFKHKIGFWQLDELHVLPDYALFKDMHNKLMNYLSLGYNQTELREGIFKFSTINKVGMDRHLKVREYLISVRGSKMFDFVCWLLYTIK